MPAQKMNDYFKAMLKAKNSGQASFTYENNEGKTTTYYRHETMPKLLNTDKKRKKPFVVYSKKKPRKSSAPKKKKRSRSRTPRLSALWGSKTAHAIRKAREKSPRTGPKSVRNKWVKIKGTGVECNFYRRQCRKSSRKR